MAKEPEGRLLSVNEACHYLHLSRSTLYHMIERNEIFPVIIGGRTLFDRKDLDELIERAKVPMERPAPRKGRKPKGSK